MAAARGAGAAGRDAGGWIDQRWGSRTRRLRVTAFRQGLSEGGYVEGKSVAIEYRWAEGRYDLIPELVADLLRRQVAIIATPGSTDAALAAKAATSVVPIVFSDGEDPVKLGLVASLARPGGNVTGIAVPATELDGKRMRLLRELIPAATSIGVLLNRSRPAFDVQSKDIQEAAHAVKQEVRILQASSEHEIGFAFAVAWRRVARMPYPRMNPITGPIAGAIVKSGIK